jgi:hypothetical protein
MPHRADEKRVTRDVELSAVRDLLDRPPRGTVAFVERDAVEIVPVRARCSIEAYSFGVPAGVAPDLEGREVVLVIDDGQYYMGGLGVELCNAGRWRLRQRYYAQAKGGPGHIVVVPESCELLSIPSAT